MKLSRPSLPYTRQMCGSLHFRITSELCLLKKVGSYPMHILSIVCVGPRREIEQCFPNGSIRHDHIEGSLEQIAGPHPALLIQQKVPRIDIPNKFPGDAVTPALDNPTLRTTEVERNYVVTAKANKTNVTEVQINWKFISSLPKKFRNRCPGPDGTSQGEESWPLLTCYLAIYSLQPKVTS